MMSSEEEASTTLQVLVGSVAERMAEGLEDNTARRRKEGFLETVEIPENEADGSA